MKPATSRLPRLSLLAALALLAPGCASVPKPRPFAIRVEVAKSLESTSMQLDLVGVNDLALPQWESYSMTDYWKPGDPLRGGAEKATLEFGLGRNTVVVFDSEDPRWRQWLEAGALHLVLIADLTDVTKDQPGNADQRRLIIPLDRRKWPRGVSVVEIEIKRSGIELKTPMKTR